MGANFKVWVVEEQDEGEVLMQEKDGCLVEGSLLECGGVRWLVEVEESDAFSVESGCSKCSRDTDHEEAHIAYELAKVD